MSSIISKNCQVGTSGTATNNFTLYQPASPDGTVRLGVGNTGATSSDVITATNAGNVGIGTSSPSQRLTVSGGLLVTDEIKGNNNLNLQKATLNNIYYTDAIAFAKSGTGETLRIDSSGNVGIGATIPSTYGNLVVNFTGSSKIVARENSTGNIAILYADGGAAFSGSVNSVPYLFLTNNTERARIDSSGNLLVGTTSADGKVSVTTSSSAPAYTSRGASGDVGTAHISLNKFDNNTTTSQRFIQFTINNGGSGCGQINANGAGAAAFGAFSDRRLKENVVDLPPQLANICSLRPVEFDYIESEGGGHQTGFIAQEMQEVYPDVVGERAPDGMLTVTGWSKTEARLVKAIQEQQALIQSLTQRIAALEAQGQ